MMSSANNINHNMVSNPIIDVLSDDQLGTNNNNKNTNNSMQNNNGKPGEGEECNQVTITIMDSGALKVTDTEGKTYMVEKEMLAREHIDPNNLTEEAINTIFGMTIQQQSVASQPSNLMSSNIDQSIKMKNNIIPLNGTSSIAEPKNLRKRRLFDQSSSDNNRFGGPTKLLNNAISSNNGPCSSSAAGDDVADDQLHLIRFSGATYYKPFRFPMDRKNAKNGTKASTSQPKFCCAVCDKAIPKTKVDFILLRLPAHTHCAKTTMMVLSDSEEEEDEAEVDGELPISGRVAKRGRRASAK